MAALLREAKQSPGWARLSRGARLTYVVAGLTCDQRGIVTPAQLSRTMRDDPETVAYAARLLAESGE